MKDLWTPAVNSFCVSFQCSSSSYDEPDELSGTGTGTGTGTEA